MRQTMVAQEKVKLKNTDVRRALEIFPVSKKVENNTNKEISHLHRRQAVSYRMEGRSDRERTIRRRTDLRSS